MESSKLSEDGNANNKSNSKTTHSDQSTPTSIDQTSPEHSNDIESIVNKDNAYKWQILGGLKDGQTYEEKPAKFCGYILKRRRRPLKGWHKRYFCLENGRLTYAKSSSDLSKGKIHGSVDIALSVISTKTASRRVDIDSDHILHLKVKTIESFNQWVANLKAHRLSRQHDLMQENSAHQIDKIICDKNQVSSYNHTKLNLNENLSCSETPTLAKLNDWEVAESLNKTQEKLIKLASLLRYVEFHDTCSSVTVTDLEGFKYKKHKRRFYLRKKKVSSQQTKDIDRPESFITPEAFQNLLTHSGSAISEENLIALSKQDQEISKSLSKTQAMQEFIQLANEANNNFRNLLKLFQNENKRLKSEEEELKKEKLNKQILNQTSFDNDIEDETLRSKLYRHSIDDSSVLSITEYYDAEDNEAQSDYNSSSSSEVDDDESVITDFSEDGNQALQVFDSKSNIPAHTGRRSKLPCVQPAGDISLWNLLCKNIGKDLSKISMPVTINEPLNVLQRLCEELEYCELLDMAAATEDPCQRMVLMAAFAVSSYSSSYYRAGHKPFNPLLGETYEFDRPDKGFKFMAEQVCHHPPVSACHAESKNYIFWQDMRVKSKFWGKSMEIIPFGMVNVYLKKFDCHYRWNKITTCVHNLFKGERYVDNYGELLITNDDKMTCKITFEKSGYWSNKKNEYRGAIFNAKGEVVEKIFGKWSESFHCGSPPTSRCIWRPGAMPEDYRLFYGFSRFAIEINELREEDKPFIPPTDTRFRPDQRLLEEGDINQAEVIKLELEQFQRERRKINEEKGLPEYVPLWFRQTGQDNGEIYEYNGNYWKSRENHFSGIEFVKLW